MLAVLSPAKKLARHDGPAAAPTQPALLDDAVALAGVARGLKPGDLKRLMKISDALADLNHERFQSFATPFTPENAHPAALTFDGDTYTGLRAPEWTDADMAFAREHVGILSGLYGLLRPTDLIQPYRLEMGTRLATERGRDLYAFWGDRITETINQRTADHADRAVINLASTEYFKSVRPRELAGPVITPIFKERRPDGSVKMISFFAKQARGAMARYLVRERLESPGGLKAFTDGGYAWDESLSSELRWVFVR